jgi:hypothetical protein
VVDAVSSELDKFCQENDALPFVVRLEIMGNSRAQEDLVADPISWINEIRAAGIDSTLGRVWIEKVILGAAARHSYEDSEMVEGPVGELLQLMEEIKRDPAELEACMEPLNDLWKKLPKELKEVDNGVNRESPQWLQQVFHEVQTMLLRRLLSKER